MIHFKEFIMLNSDEGQCISNLGCPVHTDKKIWGSSFICIIFTFSQLFWVTYIRINNLLLWSVLVKSRIFNTLKIERRMWREENSEITNGIQTHNPQPTTMVLTLVLTLIGVNVRWTKDNKTLVILHQKHPQCHPQSPALVSPVL